MAIRPASPGGRHEAAVGEREHRHRRIEIVHRGYDRIGDLRVARGLVVERAVRLDVRDAPAFGLGDRRERAELVQHAGVNLVGGQVHFLAAEVLRIVEARMRANRHALFDSPADAVVHRIGAARVPAARNIGRTDEVEQRFVGSTALAEIGIQIDFHNVPLLGLTTLLAPAGVHSVPHASRSRHRSAADTPVLRVKPDAPLEASSG